MAVVVLLDWQGITPQLYWEIWATPEWDAESPRGALHHIAWFSSSGVSACEVWMSTDHFDRFLEQSLLPEARRLGVETEPAAEIYPAHRVVSASPAHAPPA